MSAWLLDSLIYPRMASEDDLEILILCLSFLCWDHRYLIGSQRFGSGTEPRLSCTLGKPSTNPATSLPNDLILETRKMRHREAE